MLESSWSAKEFQYAINHDKKLYAFVEETDTVLIDLIRDTALNEQLDIHPIIQRIFENTQIFQKIEFFSILDDGSGIQKIA